MANCAPLKSDKPSTTTSSRRESRLLMWWRNSCPGNCAGLCTLSIHLPSVKRAILSSNFAGEILPPRGGLMRSIRGKRKNNFQARSARGTSFRLRARTASFIANRTRKASRIKNGTTLMTSAQKSPRRENSTAWTVRLSSTLNSGSGKLLEDRGSPAVGCVPVIMC